MICCLTIADAIGLKLIDTCDPAEHTHQSLKIDQLKTNNEQLHKTVGQLQEQIRHTKAEHEKITDKLRRESKNPHEKFPHIHELLRMENICKAVWFSDELTQKILSFKPITFTGRSYSPEHHQHVEIEGSIVQIQNDPKQKGKFNLCVDGIDIF